MAILRSQGMWCMVFIDDILLLDTSEARLRTITAEVILLLQQLGFRINWEKPSFHLRQFSFWDFSWTQPNCPCPFRRRSCARCTSALSADQLTVCYLTCLIGQMSAATQAITLLQAPLMPEKWRVQSYDAKLTLNQAAKQNSNQLTQT